MGCTKLFHSIWQKVSTITKMDTAVAYERLNLSQQGPPVAGKPQVP